MQNGLSTYKGTCKWFNDELGYGYITSDTGFEIFVHQRDIKMPGRRLLFPDQRVQFTVERSDTGRMYAGEVELIK